jgi:SAM-dependent methyltransferase
MEHRPVAYDHFADIYDVWTETAPAAARNLPFYIEEYVRTKGSVVELGVGKGRIAIEAARKGKPIIGVDSSSEMLRLCRLRAEAAGVAEMLTLVQADFRDFPLLEPAELITIPFHSIGYLITMEDRQAALEHIYRQLAPGGRLIFDHYVFDPEVARHYSGVRLRCEFRDPETGHDVLLWQTVRYDHEAKAQRIDAWTDELDEGGALLQRKYRRLDSSWFEPKEVGPLLEGAGFRVAALYGDFDRRPFSTESPEQIWVAEKR